MVDFLLEMHELASDFEMEPVFLLLVVGMMGVRKGLEFEETFLVKLGLLVVGKLGRLIVRDGEDGLLMVK